MLGDKVGDIRGQTIGTRILPDDGRGPCMEISDHGVGTLYGVHVDATITYTCRLRPNGTLEGEGTGVLMTDTGEAATYRGAGVGTFVRPGVTSWRGALFFETTSEKLSKLNGIACLFEFTVDESGKSEGHFTEWK